MNTEMPPSRPVPSRSDHPGNPVDPGSSARTGNSAISAAQTRDSEVSSSRIAELRALRYADYLLTPEWYRCRGRALERARWRCSRCPAKRELQVHHLRYDRLGAELDGDLEVLCRTCHEGHHFDESRRQHLGVYIKLVSDALRAGPFTTFADLSADVREECVRLKIPCDPRRISDAFNAVSSNRVPLVKAAATETTIRRDGQPFTASEASEICRRLGLLVTFKEIKPAERITQREVDQARALAMVVEEIEQSAERLRALGEDVA